MPGLEERSKVELERFIRAQKRRFRILWTQKVSDTERQGEAKAVTHEFTHPLPPSDDYVIARLDLCIVQRLE